jgi:hypothetical protein
MASSDFKRLTLLRAARQYAEACTACDAVYNDYDRGPKKPFPTALNRLAYDRAHALQAMAEAALDYNGVDTKHAEGLADVV